MTTKVRIETNRGTIVAELWPDDAINTVKNFVTLTQKGYYDGVTFHRVIDNFVVQGGDPTGTGSGGPGYAIPCETRGHRQKHDDGILSMAHAGRDTGGSQFFICLSRESTKHLDGKHTVFGKVTEGLDVVHEIKQGDQMLKAEVLEIDSSVEAHELKTLKSWR
ncbi:MAG: peptidylprolyl isomerase [Candidatus Thorarchaeota archaeon]|nr:MAG: peptidylprolyl isomerase [Candidatus Thorarchaeota archaeon]